MRHLFAVALSALMASTAAASPAPEDSWGKPGVSLTQYRQDSIDCAVQGYNLDISKTEDAKEFVRASRELDSLPGGLIATSTATGPASANSVNVMSDWAGMQQHIIESIRPEERFKSIKQMQLARIDECLVDRGYSKFRLTDDQRRRLRKLKFGSDERRVYLYRLASSPAVLATQRAPAEPSATR
jgi:hypothetical protein